jgi:hypothetical protein
MVCYKFNDVSEMLAASIIRAIIALMMEAARTSKMLVNFYQTTQHNIPEQSSSHNSLLQLLQINSPYLSLL